MCAFPSHSESLKNKQLDVICDVFLKMLLPYFFFFEFSFRISLAGGLVRKHNLVKTCYRHHCTLLFSVSFFLQRAWSVTSPLTF